MGKALLGLILCAVASAQADDKAVEDALARFKEGMRNPSPAARAAAAAELARTPHEKTLSRIASLLGDVPQVRKAAATALGAFVDYKRQATPTLLNALQPNIKEHEVRIAIFDALGKLQDPISLPHVHKSFREEDVRVAKSAIACAGAMRMKESMEQLVDLMKDCQNWIKKKQAGPYRDDKGQPGDEAACKARCDQVMAEVIKAFQSITREKWTTAQEWEIWWRKYGPKFEVPEIEKKDTK